MNDEQQQARRYDDATVDVINEVAADLGAVDPAITADALRDAFGTWLLHPPMGKDSGLAPTMNAACYAVYQLSKSRWAFNAVRRSAARWRDAGRAAGPNPFADDVAS
jgi:hypothetical protein